MLQVFFLFFALSPLFSFFFLSLCTSFTTHGTLVAWLTLYSEMKSSLSLPLWVCRSLSLCVFRLHTDRFETTSCTTVIIMSNGESDHGTLYTTLAKSDENILSTRDKSNKSWEGEKRKKKRANKLTELISSVFGSKVGAISHLTSCLLEKGCVTHIFTHVWDKTFWTLWLSSNDEKSMITSSECDHRVSE